jgi:hypothetical protein
MPCLPNSCECLRSKLQPVERKTKAQSAEIDTACCQVTEAPFPGNYPISFEEMAKACGLVIAIAHKHQMAGASSHNIDHLADARASFVHRDGHSISI